MINNIDVQSKDIKELFDAFLALENNEEARCFLRDLLTESEIKEFAARWKVARMLNGGSSYDEIQEITALSTTTIARISHWLRHGTGGYRLILKRLGVRDS